MSGLLGGPQQVTALLLALFISLLQLQAGSFNSEFKPIISFLIYVQFNKYLFMFAAPSVVPAAGSVCCQSEITAEMRDYCFNLLRMKQHPELLTNVSISK